MNSGKFPTPSDAKNEVGGSYYFIRSIVQELEYEWKMSSLKMKGDSLQEKDVSINDDLTGNIKELKKGHLSLNKEPTGAQIKGTTFKDLEAVDVAGTSDVGEMTLLRGMESASMMVSSKTVLLCIWLMWSTIILYALEFLGLKYEASMLQIQDMDKYISEFSHCM